ncbi:hypothetical protein ACG873_01595 (plasmid) [Mesorhizobium sp. AaZ16]
MATLDDKPFDQAVQVHGRGAEQVRNIGSAERGGRMAALQMAAED